MNESSVKVPTASQSCRSSALCRREAGAFGKEGPNFSLPRDDDYVCMGRQAGVDWSNTRAIFFVIVSSPGRSSQWSEGSSES